MRSKPTTRIGEGYRCWRPIETWHDAAVVWCESIICAQPCVESREGHDSWRAFIYIAVLSPSSSPLQCYAVPCRQSGATPFPTPDHPQRKRKEKGKGKEKGKDNLAPVSPPCVGVCASISSSAVTAYSGGGLPWRQRLRPPTLGGLSGLLSLRAQVWLRLMRAPAVGPWPRRERTPDPCP